MKYLAHSSVKGLSPQLYADHVLGVIKNVERYTEEVLPYCCDKNSLKHTVKQAATWHDLGKLEVANQEALNKNGNKHGLPINHVDAGTQYLLSKNASYSALIVYSHHHGLPNLIDEMEREDLYFRDHDKTVCQHTNKTYEALSKIHMTVTGTESATDDIPPNATPSVFYRMCLSCMTDADYSDTDRFYNGICVSNIVQLRAEERLHALDAYVRELNRNNATDSIRSELYSACRNTQVDAASFSLCTAPVGSGKTTAVMSHSLRQAIKRGARRIFVVLPYISIIQQSVDVYRKALALPDEKPEEVVAEIHHLVDYESPLMQRYSTTWKAPIIVTTAVAFFETLSSNKPSVLRKLHELPGSIVVLDEAHAMLPLKYMPLAWKLMEVLSKEWGCYWVMASGSTIKFWEIPQLVQTREPVTEIVSENVKRKLLSREEKRIEYRWRQMAIKRHELEAEILSFPGPRILILNTVQNASIVADDLRNQIGREHVEHLSSALTPKDRKKTIQKIKNRLSNPDDNDWVLVATSCVEAGMDFSFRTGFREISSLASLLQASGRVNRNGEYGRSVMLSFTLAPDKMFNENSAIDGSANILRQYFKRGVAISSNLVTESIKNELTQYSANEHFIKKIIKEESACSFVDVVNEMKHVIGSDTVPVLIGDEEIMKTIESRKGNRDLVQNNSVSVPIYHINEYGILQYDNGIYVWTLDYDDFIGYMAGVLPIIKLQTKECFI